MSAELGEKEEGAMATAAVATATATTATATVAPANEGGGSGSNGNGAEVLRELQSSNSNSNNNSNNNSNSNNKNGGVKNSNGIDTTYTKIFVGGLAWETNRDALKAHFEQFGDILEAVIISDKNTGRSKGYGFVTYRDPEGARRACLDPSPVIDGRRANCNLASLGLANRGRSSSLQQGYNNSNNNNNNNSSSNNRFQQGSPFNQYLSLTTPPHHQRPAYAGGFKFPAFHYPPFEQGFPPLPPLSPYGYSSYQSEQNFLGCYYNPYYLMHPQFSQVYNAGQSLGIANALNFPSPAVSSIDQKNQALLQYTHPPSANLANPQQYYMHPTLPTLPPSSPGVPLPFYSAANTVSDHVPVASPQQYTATSPPMQQFAHLPSQQTTA